MSNYQTVLKALTDSQIPFLVTGTWALKQVYPEKLKSYEVEDCDIIIPNDLIQIKKIIKLLNSIRWKTTVWEQLIDENVTDEFLKGKYYIRCRFQQLTLDITYENDHFTWEKLKEETTHCLDFQMVALEKILKLKKVKGRPQDFNIISLFE